MEKAGKPKIIVAGGGIGGLTAALSLIERGFEVEIYEQAPVLREVGAGVQISANGMLVFRELGLSARIMEEAGPAGYTVRCGYDGCALRTPPRMSRRGFRDRRRARCPSIQ